jgi:DNA-binding transcriptional LysR family regulator
MDDLSWDDLQLFLAVAEAGSLSGAARALGIGQPTVTRRLADLEYKLGGALFRRAVTGATPTDLGARLLEPARKMAEWAGEARRQVASERSGPSGVVRVSAPPMGAAYLLAPLAGKLLLEGSALRLEVNSSVRYVDLGRGEAELALRGRPATDPDLVTIREWRLPNAVFVAPALAAALGPDPAVTDIPFVAWAPPFQAVAPNPQLEAFIPNFRPSFAADDYLIQVAAAQAGAGAIVLMRARAFARLGLVALPLSLGPHAESVTCFVCARSALAIPRVRAMADRIVEELDEALAV